MRAGIQAISMVTPNGSLYFTVKRGRFKGEDVVAFLKKLLYHFRRYKLLIIWDGASQHTSDEVKHFLKKEAKGRIHLERLPTYSPELNVDEQVHGYIKKQLLANKLFKNLSQLKVAVEDGYQWLKDNAWLVHNFFFHKDVAFYDTSSA